MRPQGKYDKNSAADYTAGRHCQRPSEKVLKQDMTLKRALLAPFPYNLVSAAAETMREEERSPPGR